MHSTDVPVSIACDYLGRASDNVPLDEELPPDGDAVKRTGRLRFKFTAEYDDRNESRSVWPLAKNVMDRRRVPLPDDWLAPIRAEELPDIACASAKRASNMANANVTNISNLSPSPTSMQPLTNM